MKDLKFLIIDEQEFRNIEEDYVNSNYFQTTSWGNLKGITGWNKIYVGVRDEEKYRACSLILYKNIIMGRKLFYAPRGFLCDYKNLEVLEFFTKEIIKYIKSLGGFLFKIDPLITYTDIDLNGDEVGNNKTQELVDYLKELGYTHKGFTIGFKDDVQFRWSFCLSLSDSIETIIKNMDNRCRRCIKKSDKYPCVILEVNESNIRDFKSIMEHTCNRHECFDRSIDYYKKIKSSFKDNAKLYVIYLDREEYLDNFKGDKLYEKVKMDDRKLIPITAGVFIIDKNSLHYVYGGTIKDYMYFGFQYKLQFLMIKYAKDKGILTYDFGGISGNFDKSSPSYGIYEFKRGFGGYVVEYIGEFDFIVNKVMYFIYKFMYKFYCKFKSSLLNIKKKTEFISFYHLPYLLVLIVGIFLLLYSLHK